LSDVIKKHAHEKEYKENSALQVLLRNKNRLENFVDAVFAIAITLLVLDLAVPILKDSNDALFSFLMITWPKFLAYFIAFFVLAALLNNHHRQFINIKYADQKLWWNNMAFLAFIVLVPFSTSVISEYGDTLIGIIIFNFNLFIAGLLLYINWAIVMKRKYLLRENTTFQTTEIIKYINLSVPLTTLLVIGLAFINPRMSIFGYLLIIIFYLFAKPLFNALNPY
jgi:uncharacterized membrane protein